MKKGYSYFFSWIVIGAELATPCTALSNATGVFLPSSDLAGRSASGSEFVTGSMATDVLISVNVVGAVQKSGVHYVPTGTDLLTLIALAGGPIGQADLEHVTIKRFILNRNEQVFQINMQELLASAAGRGPLIQPHDIVFIPASEPVISPDVTSVVSIVSSVIALVTTSLLLSDRLSK